MNAKEAAARRAVALIEDGMAVGLGSGTTVDYAVTALGERVAAGLRVRLAVASSRSEAACRQAGLAPEALEAFDRFDLLIDGADELDAGLRLVKGGGAALVREKILAAAADQFIVVADAAKRVAVVGAFPLPVAIIPFGARQTVARLARFCPDLSIREKEGARLVTDDGLWLADLRCGSIPDPAALEREIKAVVGVVEVGLFVGLATRAILGHPDGRTEELWPEG